MRLLSILISILLVGSVFYFGYFVPQEKIFTARLNNCIDLATLDYSKALNINKDGSLLNELIDSAVTMKNITVLQSLKSVQDTKINSCFEKNDQIIFFLARELASINLEKIKTLQNNKYVTLEQNARKNSLGNVIYPVQNGVSVFSTMQENLKAFTGTR